MDGYIKTYFDVWDSYLESCIQNFKKNNITIYHPINNLIFYIDIEDTKETTLEQLLHLSNKNDLNDFCFQFWLAPSTDVVTSINLRYDILEVVFYVDGLEDEEIDQVELAVNDFIKENRENFLLKIVDPRGYHEEIDWFKVMLTQYK